MWRKKIRKKYKKKLEFFFLFFSNPKKSGRRIRKPSNKKGLIIRLWLAARRGHIASIIRRMNTLPPYTTLAAQLSFPARDCNCFLLARQRLVKACNSCLRDNNLSCGRRFVMLLESISIPKNVIHCTGSTTLFQLILNPNCLSNRIRVLSAVAHSFTVGAQIKKSSK